MTRPLPPIDEPRPRRKFSLWTIAAPVALLFVVIMMFNSLGESCVIKDCEASTASASAKGKPGATTADVPVRRRHRVAEGDTFQSIAEKYGLTEEGLHKCNPEISDSYSIQVDQFVIVNPKRCTVDNPSPS